MSSKIKPGFFSNLKYDLPASLVVFLVAMPLCLGIALASGAPSLFSGIIAGVVGGIVVTMLSGSPLGVSGPAAGLAAIVLAAINDMPTFETFLLAVVVAGIAQTVLGFLKAGIIGYYFPSSVIKGMLSGIGIIIILKEIPHAFGYDAVPLFGTSSSQPDGHNTFSELGYMLDGITPGALVIAAISLAILILWERPFMKKQPVFNIVQGPLVVVAIGIGLNYLFQSTGAYTLTDEHLVALPVADSVAGFFGQFTFPDFSQWNNPDVYIVGLTIAVVASLETLLCVEATDKLDPYKRITPTNRELKAQGVGNMVSGFIGGLPVTQVIVRSSANIQSGGRTKASAFFHGVLLLICAFAIPNVLNMIPLASLAAILIVVGYKLAKPSTMLAMLKKGRSEFIPYAVTIIGIVATDLLIGIAMGLVVAIFYILLDNFKSPFDVVKDTNSGKIFSIKLSEHVSFLNKAHILNRLSRLPEDSEVTIDASDSKFIHPDALEIIHDFIINAETRDITVKLIALDDSDKEDLKHIKMSA